MTENTLHWTYEEYDDCSDLIQGDIIIPDEKLRGVFGEILPHFSKPKYQAFIVTTRSCDLVIRKGKCKAEYINLVAVKSLNSVVEEILGRYCKKVSEGMYLKETKGEGKRALERVFNQNEENVGIFYLHPDVSMTLGEPTVAMLRITIALKKEHYEAIKSARKGRLETQFRNKLGWMIGNLFSKVPTEDWKEKKQSKIMREMIKEIIDAEDLYWPSNQIVDMAKKREDFKQLKGRQLKEALEECKPTPFNEAIASQSRKVLETMIDGDVATVDLDKFERRLKNDPVFSQILRDVNKAY